SASRRRPARRRSTSRGGGRSPPVHRDPHHRHHHLVVLVDELVAPADEADRLAAGRPGLEHLGAPGERIPRPHRLEPAAGVEAGRAAGRRRLAPVRVHREAHQEAAGVPAARDEAAEDAPPRRLRIGVERLRVELAREGEHLRLRDGVRAERDDLPHREVFPVLHPSVSFRVSARRSPNRIMQTATAGGQIHRSSEPSTASPRAERKRPTEIGEASTTRRASGAQYRSPDHGQRNATPSPPLVKASSTPWEAVEANRNRKARVKPAAPRVRWPSAPARPTSAATSREWLNPRWPRPAP